MLTKTRPANPLAAMSTVNLAARQRMLSQRLILQILLAVQGQEGKAAAAEQSLALFIESQSRLLQLATQLPPGDAALLKEVYFGKDAVNPLIEDFVAQCGVALRAGTPAGGHTGRKPSDAGKAAVDHIVAKVDPVLAALNRATEAFDQISNKRQALLLVQVGEIVEDIRLVAREARVVSFNAQVIAARAGAIGREFAVVASTLSKISNEVDALANKGLALVRG